MSKRLKEIFYEKLDEIHTSDAYFQNVIFENSCLIVPYINVGVSEHPLNESSVMKYVSHSYLVAIGVTYLKSRVWDETGKEGKDYIITNTNETVDKIYWGGENTDNKSVYNDMTICCSEAFIKLLHFSDISDNYWIPHDTPNFKRNMSDDFNKLFFRGQFIPNSLKVLHSDLKK